MYTVYGVSTVKPLCEDKITNCDEYGKSSCTGSFVAWAQEHCPAYCGLCPTTPGTTVVVTAANCVDKDPSCSDYAAVGYCTDPAYISFVNENCKKTCNLCELDRKYFGYLRILLTMLLFYLFIYLFINSFIFINLYFFILIYFFIF
ncbi:hypothetical protein KUTeg_019123 [Tegillarca granosa]|uniref:ShKT domain-containing protein n=1 Tax=Tegillarca granosa TaxID=220873 RepID=A0ABQ9EGL6_TEGGR|nr:hypothetical protein KUTeg_019123 [Tegillarca granosa]